MACVHSRVFLTISAWLLGAIAATGGSLVAVALIGQSIGGPATQQLTASGINRALAADNHGSGSSPADSPSATATPARPPAKATPSAPVSGASPAAAAPTGTLLSSPGGSVVAACYPAGAYLISWSPQSGYTADDVLRGPAATAQLQFESGSQGVSMVVTCTGSVPSASVTTAGNDDGGGGGGEGGPGGGGGPGDS
jgi:serine/threonine-protein kinase